MTDRRQVLRALARGQVPWWVSGTASFVLAVAALVLAATWLTYAHRVQVDGARSPVIVERAAGIPAVRWRARFDTLEDRRQYSVVQLEPLSGGRSPMPPGVGKVLQPGEVVLSPALAHDGAGEVIGSRYGRTVGLIGQEGLSDPQERLAYVGVGPGVIGDDSYLVTGYGRPPKPPWGTGRGGAFFGETLQIQPLVHPMLVAGVLVVLPAAVLAWALAGAGTHHRRRRELLLEALGAPAGLRRRMAVGGAAPGVVVGAVAAYGLWLVWGRAWGWVPLVEFRLPAGVVGAWLPPAAAAVAGLTALALLVLRRPHRSRGTRPTEVRDGVPSWAVTVGPVSAVVTAWIGGRLRPGGSSGWQLPYWVAGAVTVVAAAVSIAALMALTGRLLRRVGRRAGSASVLLGGAALVSVSRPVSRLAAGQLAFLVTAFQALTVSLMLADFQLAGRALQQMVGPSVLVVETSYDEADRLRAALPPRTALLGVRAGHPVVTGTCADLRLLGLGCSGSTPAADLPAGLRVALIASVQGLGPPVVEVRVAATSRAGPSDQVLLARADGQALDLPRTKLAAHRALASWSVVERPGDSDLSGAAGVVHSGRWVGVFTALGLAMTSGAVSVAGRSLAQRIARTVAPLVALHGRPRRGLGVAAVALGLPVVAAGWAGAALAYLLSVPMHLYLGEVAPLRWTAAACGAVSLLAGAACTAVGAREIHRAALAWRPGSDRD